MVATFRIVPASAAAALAAASVVAQSATWRIPPLGAVEYRRTEALAASAPQKSAAQAKAAAVERAADDRCVPRLPPAPFVCQGELRADQKALVTPVRDLRDALRAIACDLSTTSAVRARFPQLLPFGDVVVTGAWSQPDASGVQRLRATLAASAPAGEHGKLLAPFVVADAAGQLVGARVVDPARGLVARFDGSFDLVVDERERGHRRLVVADAWELVAVRENQDFDFRKRVAAGIRGGAAWVRAQIEEKKSFFVDQGGDDRNFGDGRLALGLLALLHGGVPPADAVVQKGFAELRRRKLEDSYSLAAALMALVQLHTPVGEAARLRDGELAAASARRLPDADHALATKWLQRLLHNVDPRGATQDVLRFNYTAGPRYDTSLQQYGLLGLWAARAGGLAVAPSAFAAAGRHLIDVQGKGGAPQPVTFTSYAQLRASEGTDAPPKATTARASPRGFAYQEASEPAFGSMTSAGLSGLLLARAGLGDADRALRARFDDAIDAAYSWLAANFCVRSNPGFAERADRHWYYWLYCLERSCELAGIARLDGRDWYYEGALQLLANQQDNGSFRAEQPSTLLLDSTCFAILFLAKATAAAPVTGR
jgi:hypothetical protein